MDDQFPKDENSAKVDYVVPESGPGEEAVGFSAKAQQERFLGGGDKAHLETNASEASKVKEVTAPNIKYEFFFAPHSSPTDQKGLQERFKEADVYIPEGGSAWTQKQLDMIRALANGDIEIDISQKFPGEDDGSPNSRLAIKEIRMIYKSHKPITIIDMPSSSLKDQKRKSEPNWNGTFSKMLVSMRERSANLLGPAKEREQHMLRQLEPKVKELIEEYPYLKSKKDIKVLLSLGISHDPIYIDLKKRGEETVRFFSQASPSFSFVDEGARRLRFHKTIDDELASKIYLEWIFDDSFGRDIDRTTEDTLKYIKLGRRIINQFSLEEAKQVFESIKNRQDPRQVMEAKLKEKNIQIPQSEQQLDEFLAKPLPRSDTVQIIRVGSKNNLWRRFRDALSTKR